MKFKLSCKDMTEISCDEDRKLTLNEKILFKFHLLICKCCDSYIKQLDIIKIKFKEIYSEKNTIDEDKIKEFNKKIIKENSKVS